MRHEDRSEGVGTVRDVGRGGTAADAAAHASGEVGTVTTCTGSLLVHEDGSPAACSEELEGRRCAGPGAAHRGGTMRCEDLLGPGCCEICALERWTPRLWAHAVHLGRRRDPRVRCAAHTRNGRGGRAPSGAVMVGGCQTNPAGPRGA